MKKICLALSLLLPILLLPLSSPAFEIGARGYYWSPSLDGTVEVDKASIIGTTIDFDEDLGIEDGDYSFFEVFAGVGNHHLCFIHADIDYSGRKTLTRQIIFRGKTYPISALVTSSIQYKMMDFSYQYDFLNLENVLGGFSLGGVFQVKYLDGSVNLKTTGIDEKEDFTVPIPMVGLNLDMGILAQILKVRLRGTAISYSESTIYELMGDISWTPFPLVDIHAGYRSFVIDIHEDDLTLDQDMSGPYAALTVSF